MNEDDEMLYIPEIWLRKRPAFLSVVCQGVVLWSSRLVLEKLGSGVAPSNGLSKLWTFVATWGWQRPFFWDRNVTAPLLSLHEPAEIIYSVALDCLWFLFFGVFNAHAEIASQEWLRISHPICYESVLISIWFYAYSIHSMFNPHFLLLDAVTEGPKSGTTLKLINIFCGPSWFEFEISDLHGTIGGDNMQLWRGECIH